MMMSKKSRRSNAVEICGYRTETDNDGTFGVYLLYEWALFDG